MTFAEPPTGHGFRIERLTEGVYVGVAVWGDDPPCNVGIVDLGGGTLIFDTLLTPQAALNLGAAVESLTGRPARYLVNSHWHNDHVHGNATLVSQAAGAPVDILATRRTYELILTRSAENLHEIQTTEGVEPQELAAAAATITLLPPNLLFETRLTLHGTRRSVELLTFGGGHTGSDSMLYLPDERIVFAGDLVAVETHPFLADGDFAQLRQSLAGIAALDAAILVPGHGPIGMRGHTADYIQVNRAYAETVERLTRELAAHRVTEQEASATPIPAEYAEWRAPEVFGWNMAEIVERMGGLVAG